jgi:CopG family nickel-responsive transcriptional regulator
MTNIVRVGVTFPPELLRELDKAVTTMGYASRSKAINDSVRAFVTEQKWLEDIKGNKVGSITMIYKHEMRELESDLTDTQHQFSSIICASMHVHISKEKCLETITVRGSANEIKRLVEKLRARRGVEDVKLNIFSI